MSILSSVRNLWDDFRWSRKLKRRKISKLVLFSVIGAFILSFLIPLNLYPNIFGMVITYIIVFLLWVAFFFVLLLVLFHKNL